MRDLAYNIALVAILATLHPSGAMAQDAEREQTAAARAMFQAGIQLADRGDWQAAADRFRRSLALRPSTVVAYNLGMALTHTGELVEATELFRGAVRDPDAPSRLREAARRELEALEPRLGRLILELRGSRDGVELRLDDEPMPMEMVGVAIPADPGPHVLTALRSDAVVARAEVTITEGEPTSLAMNLPATVPSPEEVARGAQGGGSSSGVGANAGSDDTALWVAVITTILAVAAAAAGVTAWYFLDGQEPAEPIPGNLMPGTVEF